MARKGPMPSPIALGRGDGGWEEADNARRKQWNSRLKCMSVTQLAQVSDAVAMKWWSPLLLVHWPTYLLLRSMISLVLISQPSSTGVTRSLSSLPTSLRHRSISRGPLYPPHASTGLVMDKDEAQEYLQSLLNKNLRVITTDGRLFWGSFKCTDPVRRAARDAIPVPPTLLASPADPKSSVLRIKMLFWPIRTNTDTHRLIPSTDSYQRRGRERLT